MIEVAISFGLFAIFSLGIDWMNRVVLPLFQLSTRFHPIGATGVQYQMGLIGANDDTLSATEFYDEYVETGEN